MNVQATLKIFVLVIMAAAFVSPASLHGGDVHAIDYDDDAKRTTEWQQQCMENCLAANWGISYCTDYCFG
uniref:Gsp_25 putative toxin n=1 Tax=Gemmula speciosa TaxID=439592 RepID=A0A098LXU5_GEMSP